VFQVVKAKLRKYRLPNSSFLVEILRAFSYVTHDLVVKEYLEAINFWLKHPFNLPPCFRAQL
jgi:hypothetical protein